VVETSNGISEAMADLGIDPRSLDSDSSPETDAVNTDVEGDVEGDAVKATEQQSPEEGDVETKDTEEVTAEPAAQEAPEEPKLTFKEFQEIQEAKSLLETERKAFMEEKAQMEKELHEKYHEKIKIHDAFDSFLDFKAEHDPEFFSLMKGDFQEWRKQNQPNPEIEETRREIKEIRGELDKFKSRASDEVTLAKLDTELHKFNSTLGKDAEAAGLKIDHEVIKDMWAKGLTVEEAFFAKYGASFAKAQASKAKVETVTKKVQARPAVNTAGNVKSSAQKTSPQVPSDAFGAVQYFAKQFMK
jgi:hypothetical protein